MTVWTKQQAGRKEEAIWAQRKGTFSGTELEWWSPSPFNPEAASSLGLGGDRELLPDIILKPLVVPLPVVQAIPVLGARTRKDRSLLSRRPAGLYLGSLGVDGVSKRPGESGSAGQRLITT